MFLEFVVIVNCCVGFYEDFCFGFSCENSCSVFGGGLLSILNYWLSFVFCFLLVIMLLFNWFDSLVLCCVSIFCWFFVMFVSLLVVSAVSFLSASWCCFVILLVGGFYCLISDGFALVFCDSLANWLVWFCFLYMWSLVLLFIYLSILLFYSLSLIEFSFIWFGWPL